MINLESRQDTLRARLQDSIGSEVCLRIGPSRKRKVAKQEDGATSMETNLPLVGLLIGVYRNGFLVRSLYNTFITYQDVLSGYVVGVDSETSGLFAMRDQISA